MKRLLSLLLASFAVSLGPAGAGAAAPPSLSFSPDSWDFGTISPGSSSAPKTFELKNSGGSATAALRVTITDTGAAAFTKTADTCSATSLGPGKTCSITIVYSPSAAGATDTATLTAMSKKPSASASASLTGHGTPANTAPVANTDNYSVAEGGTLTIPGPGVLVNDTDAEGNPLTAVLVSGPANASSFTLNADGSFLYVHNGSETTTDSFTYKANDGTFDSNVALVSITVVPVNDAPVANDDGPYSVAEGGTLNIAGPGVLGNDTDNDGPLLTAVLVSGPANASSFTLNADGSFLYVHNGSETTTDSFLYMATDGSLNSNVATVTIIVTPVNDAPVANNDGPYSVAEDNVLNGSSVLANDTDAENASLTAVLVTGPANASSFTLNTDGTFTYTPVPNFTGTVSFTYRANDGSANSNVATVTIAVVPVNDLPSPRNDLFLLSESGGAASRDLLLNDTDADGDTLTLFGTCFDLTIDTGLVVGDVAAKLPGLAAVTVDSNFSDGTPCRWEISTTDGRSVSWTLDANGVISLNTGEAALSPFSGLSAPDLLRVIGAYSVTDGNGAVSTAQIIVGIEGA